MKQVHGLAAIPSHPTDWKAGKLGDLGVYSPPPPSLAAGRSCRARGQLPAEPKPTRGLRDLKALDLPSGAGLEGVCPPHSHQKERTLISSRALLSSLLRLIPLHCEASPEVPGGGEVGLCPFSCPRWNGTGELDHGEPFGATHQLTPHHPPSLGELQCSGAVRKHQEQQSSRL